MKRLLLILFVSLLCGCSSTRKHSSSAETKIADKTEADLTRKLQRDSTIRTDSVAEVTTLLTRNREVVIRQFDTGKPVDPATGTPPLASETVIREQQDARWRAQTSVKSETGVQERDSVVDRSKYDQSVERRSSQTVKAKRAVPWWLCLAGTAAAIGLIYGVWRRFRF